MPFYAIAAMSENRVIGDHGKIPWHLPEDFRWFKHKTMGGTLVMGRKTFESIGKSLPGRKTIVLSRFSAKAPALGVPLFSMAGLLAQYLPEHPDETYWVCGGGEIYRQLLDHCHYVYLTVVKKEIEGDTFFPSIEHLGHNHFFDQTIHDAEQFRVERWQHKEIPVQWHLPHESWPFLS
jgi:dihydrofolate reductase